MNPRCKNRNVIPAKAGIHVSVGQDDDSGVGVRLRGHDVMGDIQCS
jgi:hypothetical protein